MSDESVSAASYREVVEGRVNEDYVRHYPFAPFLSGDPLKRYVHLKNRYSTLREKSEKELPATFEGTKYAQRMLFAHSSVEVSDVVREGNLSMLAFLSGLLEREVPAPAAELLSRLVSELLRPGFMCGVVGHTDHGKTNTAFWLAELAMSFDDEIVLLTNVDVDLPKRFGEDRYRKVTSSSEAFRVADEVGKSVLVLDELSIEANAQTKNYEVVDNFYEVVTHKSKLDTRIIAIGHRVDGLDLAPSLRAHAKYMLLQERVDHVNEPDEYVGRFHDVDDAEIGEELFNMEVPKTTIGYDADEPAPFAIAE